MAGSVDGSIPSDRYWGSWVGFMPLRAAKPGNSRKTASA